MQLQRWFETNSLEYGQDTVILCKSIAFRSYTCNQQHATTCIVQFMCRHIPSYWDDFCKNENLDSQRQRNVGMDSFATYLMFDRRHKNKNYTMSVSHNKGYAIIISNTKFDGNYIPTIHDIIQGRPILKYWNKQGRFPAEQNVKIDWNVIKHARESLPFYCKIGMTKHVSGFCGTGINMKLWKYKDTYVCSLCNEIKDNLHIIQCRSTIASDR